MPWRDRCMAAICAGSRPEHFFTPRQKGGLGFVDRRPVDGRYTSGRSVGSSECLARESRGVSSRVFRFRRLATLREALGMSLTVCSFPAGG